MRQRFRRLACDSESGMPSPDVSERRLPPLLIEVWEGSLWRRAKPVAAFLMVTFCWARASNYQHENERKCVCVLV